MRPVDPEGVRGDPVTTASGGESTRPSLVVGFSAGGRYVAWRSAGADFVPGDTIGVMDVFWAPIA